MLRNSLWTQFQYDVDRYCVPVISGLRQPMIIDDEAVSAFFVRELRQTEYGKVLNTYSVFSDSQNYKTTHLNCQYLEMFIRFEENPVF